MTKVHLILTAFCLTISATPLFGQSVTINWTNTHQVIDGFGANCSDLAACDGMTAAQAQAAFDPVNGIGLSLLRDVIPSDGSCSGACNFESETPAQYIIKYGGKVWATPWSPPAPMKSNGSTICNTGSGKSTLNTSSYGAFASYVASFATQFKAHYGAPLYAISVQNEPNFCPTTYDGTTWNSTQIDSFVKSNLGPTLAGTGVKIVIPEGSSWDNLGSLADTCMTDSSCLQYVGIVANHDYTMQNGLNPGSVVQSYSNLGSSAHLWETETACLQPTSCPLGAAFNGSLQDGINWAYIIHLYLTKANVSAWHYWRLFNSSGANNNEALIQSDGTVATRFYILGNWSKFVRPGWVRIDATSNPASGVYVSAFKDPVAGGFAVVAVNQNSSSVSLPISLSGFPTVDSVTPTVTSSGTNLKDQEAVSVSSNSFTYSLPAMSVVTFHGATSTNSGKNLTPPTSLTATVH